MRRDWLGAVLDTLAVVTIGWAEMVARHAIRRGSARGACTVQAAGATDAEGSEEEGFVQRQAEKKLKDASAGKVLEQRRSPA